MNLYVPLGPWSSPRHQAWSTGWGAAIASKIRGVVADSVVRFVRIRAPSPHYLWIFDERRVQLVTGNLHTRMGLLHGVVAAAVVHIAVTVDDDVYILSSF